MRRQEINHSLLHYLLLVAILVLASGGCCEGFQLWNGRLNLLSKSIVAVAMSVRTEELVDWRWLSKGLNADEEIDRILRIRKDWSEPQYKQALDLYDSLMECDDTYVAPLISEALGVIDNAYRLYGPTCVIGSYNGGKDAVVILHLMRAAHANYYRSKGLAPIQPRVVYFDHADEFPEILELLKGSVSEYEMDMVAFERGTKFQDGLKILVEHNFPHGNSMTLLPMAFVLGTRNTDPNAGNQGHFAPASSWMPPFMRVNPILNWTYGHVWHFLRLFHLPYCVLYDQGYTSLGTVKDTLPCPALAVVGNDESSDSTKYWPAYMLRDWDQERAGRIKKEKDDGSKKAKATSTDASSHKSPEQLSTITDLGRAESCVPVSSVQVVAEPDSEVSQATLSIDSDSSVQRTVGLLIIGDEILKGITADTNTQSAAQALRQQNVPLSKVVVVSDDQTEIVDEIHRMQREVDVVITSGGVGPTHDDVTIKSVAAALKQEVVLNEEMAQLLRDKMNDGEDKNVELTEAQIKMATLPANAKLRYLSQSKRDWPHLQCQNIFILPGIPQFFAKKMQALATYLSSQLERSVSYKVVLSVDEASIVDALNEVVSRHEDVVFGSYPFVEHSFKTVVTLEGRMMKNGGSGRGGWARNSSINLDRSEQQKHPLNTKEMMDQNVRKALDDLINSLPNDSILRVDNNDGVLFS